MKHRDETEPLSIDFDAESSTAAEILGLSRLERRQMNYEVRPFFARTLLLHISFFLLYLISAGAIAKVLSVRSSGDSCRAEPQIYSPAREAAKHKLVTIDSSKLLESPFAGNPGPEVDQAWDNLMSRINIRVSEDVLRRINQTSIPLADGSKHYWGSVQVFHQLHCLKVIRQYLAKDHYPEAQQYVMEPGMAYPEHIEHCLQTLRVHLMCQPDLNLYTYGWRPDKYDPHAHDKVEHICVDWKWFESWLDERSFSEYDEQGLIRRPDGIIWDPSRFH